jgi:hypothetical protein
VTERGLVSTGSRYTDSRSRGYSPHDRQGVVRQRIRGIGEAGPPARKYHRSSQPTHLKEPEQAAHNRQYVRPIRASICADMGGPVLLRAIGWLDGRLLGQWQYRVVSHEVPVEFEDSFGRFW